MPALRMNSKPEKTACASTHCWLGGCPGGTADGELKSIEKSPNMYTPASSAPQHTQTVAFSAPLLAGGPLTNPANPGHTPRT